jgi:hypothetical protein
MRVFFLFTIINIKLGGFFMRKSLFLICCIRSLSDGVSIDKAERRVIFEKKKRDNKQKSTKKGGE